ncbi:MerR family regulatory protein [Paramicrobacterium humi]|uniref:MerR family regulatory protein n=1 Tax=Paramicrobacterium humi TaxID=640635 RepID=A0A1H4TTP2_9MICO|nr:MerR family transcriptional regulator [Microbacterium humi]SEC59862.1 MerR family regulatory protein [Microbacterium humi]
MAANAARSSSAAPQLLNIGQVLARLRADFPDLSSSKLRFLEEQGLVSPARTQSGYRKFSMRDVERLRLTLSMQRDHYLPLKVIRAYLADLDAGKSPAFPGLAEGAPTPTIIPGGKRYKRAELLREANASPGLLADAISASLIPPGDSFAEDALTMLKSLVSLQRCGIEPRHLRGFRTAADREVDLIESALLPMARRKDAASRARAAELAGDIAGHLEAVRNNLIRAALGRISP